jgi:predicted nucleic acid-binding protein
VLLVDTGIFIAAGDRNEPHHQSCGDLLRSRSDLAIVAPAVAETAWLVEDRLGPQAEAAFLRLVISVRFDIVDLVPGDYDRCLELIETYDDLGLGFVDASIIAVAERLGQSTLATLNRRDFAVVRPAHRDAFDLVP